ncbi:putative membrane protein YhiD involved in acid resistance [Rhodoblastus acidophilus]|uniref:hypothetical protein n=1 Tax=Rhodoblastus acidophilus TaxID=1074 RepID=UPI0022245FE5|nr:hypothetical protein [Rhodoblastus acidophilus]MCW2286685.1 putative membrane protein YhiD involved in acid resistance [Rhodoblastus acidophilus]MCW2335505.1 putative membrane protein YhiD involved in acid resistance [Rhodoblastus acidophilus]
MGQFLTDNAVTGVGGDLVKFIDKKIGLVDKKVSSINKSFWSIAAAVLALVVAFPALTIPVAWIEIDKVRTERMALEDAQKQSKELIATSSSERAEVSKFKAAIEENQQKANELLTAATKERAEASRFLEQLKQQKKPLAYSSPKRRKVRPRR